jgi:8-oxo-dGTP diphosphatase
MFEGATAHVPTLLRISLVRVQTTIMKTVQRKWERGTTKSVVLKHSIPSMKAFPKTPALMTDCVVFEPDGRVLLVRRKHEPFAGCYALPGGFVDVGETVEAACCREVREETGVSVSKGQLHLIGVYSDPDRDPRGHSVSIAYRTTLEQVVEPQSGSDAEAAEWVSDWRKVRLAFNHAEILADATQMQEGEFEWQPREAFWRGLEHKLRRP